MIYVNILIFSPYELTDLHIEIESEFEKDQFVVMATILR